MHDAGVFAIKGIHGHTPIFFLVLKQIAAETQQISEISSWRRCLYRKEEEGKGTVPQPWYGILKRIRRRDSLLGGGRREVDLI